MVDPSEPAPAEPVQQPTLLDRALRPFADVRAGEGGTALLMMVNIFVVLFAYYVLKTTREPLILVLEDGPKLKSYASAVQAGVLIAVLPLFNWLTSAVDTRRLLFGMVAFFLVCIEAFYFAWAGELPIGFVFFVWVGIFSLSSIALFWGFANEVYPRVHGERIFPFIGIGMTGGAFAGSFLAGRLFGEQVSPGAVLQVAAGLLVVHGVLYALVLRRPDVNLVKPEPKQSALRAAVAGFELLFRRKYIGQIAALILLLNLVNTTGEYVLSEYVIALTDEAQRAALAGGVIEDVDEWRKSYVGEFYGNFFLWVNVASVTMQAFLASRLVDKFGIAGALLALPIVAGVGYGLAFFGVGFMVFRWAKTAENATDYSIMNTARAMLWLPTSREDKYKAKQTIDTLVVRSGDVLSAGLVFAGTTWMEFGPRGFAGVNLVLIVTWLVLARWLLQSYRAESAAAVEAEAA